MIVVEEQAMLSMDVAAPLFRVCQARGTATATSLDGIMVVCMLRVPVI